VHLSLLALLQDLSLIYIETVIETATETAIETAQSGRFPC